MLPQIIELILLGSLAFFLITKLLSIVGRKEEDTSFFGENSEMKDVTHSAQPAQMPEQNLEPNMCSRVMNHIQPGNVEKIKEGMRQLNIKMGRNFDMDKFISTAARVFFLVKNSMEDEDYETLQELVDKTQLDKVKKTYESYKLFSDTSALSMRLMDIYFFGNSAYIRIWMSGRYNRKPLFEQEWTFVRKVTDTSPKWLISDVEDLPVNKH